MSSITDLVQKHEEYRKSTLNLQASENAMSPNALKVLSSDLSSRYSLLLPGEKDNAYGGTKYSEEILSETEKLARDVYGSKFSEVRALGGHIAAEIVILSMVRKKDNILALAEADGGYTGYSKKFLPDMFSFQSYKLPFDKEQQEIDFVKLDSVMNQIKPRLLLLGQSFFVRPYDLKRVREIADEHDSSIAYDASHVMGLIAGGKFQPDALKYSDVVFGSTHKSFFGPQGGIILTNDEGIYQKMLNNLTWKTIDNYHISRVAALGVALEEMKKYGSEYASQVVANSKSLGKNLEDRNIGVKFSPWFSESHQIHLNEEWLDQKRINYVVFSKRLEENGIVVDREGRLGTSEITRMGVTDTKRIAELVDKAANNISVKDEVLEYVKSLKMTFW